MSTTLTFASPPPGLAPLVDFVLNEIPGVEGLYALQSVDDASRRLFVLDAGQYLPAYTPEISDEQCEALALRTPDEASVLVVVNPTPGNTTVNLAAPIVLNTSTGVAAQVILEGQDWPLQAELGAEAAA